MLNIYAVKKFIMKNIQKKAVAIYESENSNKVVKFLLSKRFTDNFIKIRDNGLLDKCYLDENNNVLAKETSGTVHSKITLE